MKINSEATELGSFLNRSELADMMAGGRYAIMEKDLSFDVRPLPFTDVVTSRVRGKKA